MKLYASISDEIRRKIEAESKMKQTLAHPYLLATIDSYTEHKQHYVVGELASGMTL